MTVYIFSVSYFLLKPKVIAQIMKRSLSEVTIDLNDQDAMDAEHNNQIQKQIENLKKQFKIKNHTIPYVTAIEMKKQISQIVISKPEYISFTDGINIAQYTIFKHDVFNEGVIFEKIWQCVGDIGISPIAEVHLAYEYEIDRARDEVAQHRERANLFGTLYRESRGVCRELDDRMRMARDVLREIRVSLRVEPINHNMIYNRIIDVEQDLGSDSDVSDT